MQFCNSKITPNMQPESPFNCDMKFNPEIKLVILEEPVDKFRFRYKSEMQGTHGSLTGHRSEKTKKTFPEVELQNFNKSGMIRCSLYQANIDKLHSHLLAVQKDGKEFSDPHDVTVSPDLGYIVRFENMGIMQTAKKDISKELLRKKIEKYQFEEQCNDLSLKMKKSLREEADREAKVMNLNQVRLCFEAFQIMDGGRYERICEPVFSNVISNRKSAQTGELKICRLSIYTGTAEGGDDLILLVEKVNKTNIKVRFYETLNGKEIWEAYGSFTEADVHHQYAIVVRTPPYQNKDIDTHVNVFIELVRESDNERSLPVAFRYKPRSIIMTRKRRRTSSTLTSNSWSSLELSYDTSAFKSNCMPQQLEKLKLEPQNLTEDDISIPELDSKEYFCKFNTFMQQVDTDSDELKNLIDFPLLSSSELFWEKDDIEIDGEASVEKLIPKKKCSYLNVKQYHPYIKELIVVFNGRSRLGFENTIAKVKKIFDAYTSKNENGDSIVHDIIKQGYPIEAKIVFKILSNLNLTSLLSITDNCRQTPLHIACVFDKPEFIRPLLGLKCDPNIQDIHGDTALHIAVGENLLQCTENLASQITSIYLNPNLTNNDGLTPLHLAIRRDNIEIVKILLFKCNASAKLTNLRDGNNAMHLAVQQQNVEIVKAIMENGNFNLSEKNRAGNTAIDLVHSLKEPKRKEILDIIKLPKMECCDFEDSSDSTVDEDDKSSVELNECDEVYMRKIIQDEKFCKLLSKLLNPDNKWKILAKKLRLDHLICMWVNAEEMVKYVVAIQDIKVMSLIEAVQEVDQNAARVIRPLLTPN